MRPLLRADGEDDEVHRVAGVAVGRGDEPPVRARLAVGRVIAVLHRLGVGDRVAGARVVSSMVPPPLIAFSPAAQLTVAELKPPAAMVTVVRRTTRLLVAEAPAAP